MEKSEQEWERVGLIRFSNEKCMQIKCHPRIKSASIRLDTCVCVWVQFSSHRIYSPPSEIDVLPLDGTNIIHAFKTNEHNFQLNLFPFPSWCALGTHSATQFNCITQTQTHEHFQSFVVHIYNIDIWHLGKQAQLFELFQVSAERFVCRLPNPEKYIWHERPIASSSAATRHTETEACLMQQTHTHTHSRGTARRRRSSTIWRRRTKCENHTSACERTVYTCRKRSKQSSSRKR